MLWSVMEDDDDILLWLIEAGIGIVILALDMSVCIGYAIICVAWNIIFGDDYID